jgi:hypothetical protein
MARRAAMRPTITKLFQRQPREEGQRHREARLLPEPADAVDGRVPHRHDPVAHLDPAVFHLRVIRRDAQEHDEVRAPLHRGGGARDVRHEPAVVGDVMV